LFVLGDSIAGDTVEGVEVFCMGEVQLSIGEVS
jgi:hypothetical protein